MNDRTKPSPLLSLLTSPICKQFLPLNNLMCVNVLGREEPDPNYKHLDEHGTYAL